MMIEIQQSEIEALYRDPVLAVHALMGWRMDHFQAVALKLDWHFPYTIDLSGTGSGKTFRLFCYLALRCALLEDHVALAYFPTWGGVGKMVFWPYFARTVQRSPVFARQLRMHRKKLGEEKGGSCWTMHFRNLSRIDMPAPDFLNDARNQAGQSANTVAVDEFLQITAKSSGLDAQIIERARRPSLSKEHNWLCNHIKLKGHAESPSHPGYSHVRAYKSLIRDGSTKHAVYSFCYKDASDDPVPGGGGKSWRELLVEKDMIATQKRALSASQFARQILGITDRDGATFYPETMLMRCARRWLRPETKRLGGGRTAGGQWHYVLGFDSAPGQGVRSDFAAAAVTRVREVDPNGPELQRMSEPGGPQFIRIGSHVFECAKVWAWKGQNLGAMSMAYLIHLWNVAFGFSSIVLDPGGGGQLIYKELMKPEVEHNGQRMRVVPLCTRHELASADKHAIVHFFSRGNNKGTGPGDFNELIKAEVGPGFLIGDDGFNAAAHVIYQRRWHAREIHCVMPHKYWQDAERQEARGWLPEQAAAQTLLEEELAQLTAVRQLLDKNGAELRTARGFNVWGSNRKKDVAYAGMYSQLAAELLMFETAGGGMGAEEEPEFA